MTKSPSDQERAFRGNISEDIRPWGKFRAYPHQHAGSLKIITVKPGGSLSLQFHRRRSEFWVVLDSGLEITVGRKAWRPRKGEEISSLKGYPTGCDVSENYPPG